MSVVKERDRCDPTEVRVKHQKSRTFGGAITPSADRIEMASGRIVDSSGICGHWERSDQMVGAENPARPPDSSGFLSITGPKIRI